MAMDFCQSKVGGWDGFSLFGESEGQAERFVDDNQAAEECAMIDSKYRWIAVLGQSTYRLQAVPSKAQPAK